MKIKIEGRNDFVWGILNKGGELITDGDYYLLYRKRKEAKEEVDHKPEWSENIFKDGKVIKVYLTTKEPK